MARGRRKRLAIELDWVRSVDVQATLAPLVKKSSATGAGDSLKNTVPSAVGHQPLRPALLGWDAACPTPASHQPYLYTLEFSMPNISRTNARTNAVQTPISTVHYRTPWRPTANLLDRVNVMLTEQINSAKKLSKPTQCLTALSLSESVIHW